MEFTVLTLLISLREIIPSLFFSRDCFFMAVLKKTYQIFHWKHTYVIKKNSWRNRIMGWFITLSVCVCVCMCMLDHVWLFCDPLWNYSLPDLSVHGVFQVRNTGVGCCFLLQKIFPNQELNPHLLHLLHLAGGFIITVPHGKPVTLKGDH